MSVNAKIFEGTVPGVQQIYLDINSTSATSFQITHPNTGLMVIRVSNDTRTTNIKDPAQMALVQFLDLKITQPDGTETYLINLADPQWFSPCGIGIECLNAQYMNIEIQDVGDYKIEQHVNSVYTKEE